MVSPALGREACTQYRVLASYPAGQSAHGSHIVKLLLVTLFTGRTHQIRVHMASLRQPLVGDSVYGEGSKSFLPGSRLFLHCLQISLQDLKGKPFIAHAPLPDELAEILAALTPLKTRSEK
eukprot:TRINITY_DN21860_c0_g1_i1.p1 TRINITY_DN21860_c0_g1~~TRINITY_DN21860_c0_g1_i1.p1  ORF type:complete len:137 (+),score=10.49 TRINITY_DN21860_c0_g1_i1:50-412(+)